MKLSDIDVDFQSIEALDFHPELICDTEDCYGVAFVSITCRKCALQELSCRICYKRILDYCARGGSAVHSVCGNRGKVLTEVAVVVHL